VLQRTQLYEYHKEHAKLTEFAGFEMPLWYSSISDEHMAVRTSIGLFDVSHMGRLSLKGKDARRLIDSLVPTSLTKVRPGRSFYSVLCNWNGGVVDDIVTMQLSDDEYIMITNCANVAKDMRWLEQNISAYDVKLEDISSRTQLFALQGPLAEVMLEPLIGMQLSGVKRFEHFRALLSGFDVMISRTGYTGEDGFEILVLDSTPENPRAAESVWRTLLQSGWQLGLKPCGLGARDTLRLEAGFCLYGQDLTDSISPLEAGLGWLVSLEKGDFVGREALQREKREGSARRRVGFIMDEGIARAGNSIYSSDREVGVVTSGTFSPLLKRGIGMGYVKADFREKGIQVDVRGRRYQASLSQMPFYDVAKYGYRRSANNR